MTPTWYFIVREVQLWACLIPTTLFLIGYTWYIRKRRFAPATWYILGWTVTCEFAFVLSFLRRLFPDTAWVRYVGVVLGLMIVVMCWAMLFLLVQVFRKQRATTKEKRTRLRMEGDPGYDASDHQW